VPKSRGGIITRLGKPQSTRVVLKPCGLCLRNQQNCKVLRAGLKERGSSESESMNLGVARCDLSRQFSYQWRTHLLKCKTTLALLLAGCPAFAATIDVVGSDLENVLFGAVQFQLKTGGGRGNITPGQTGFQPGNTATATDSSSTTTGVFYSAYGVPGGATLLSATLNFSGVFGTPSITAPVQSPPNSYATSPTFSDSLGTLLVTISSTLGGSAVVTGASGTNYDLAPQFGADLLANNPITVQWTATATFSRTLPPSPTGCANCSEIFNVSDTRSFTASNTANSLHIEYDVVSAVPEPGSLFLAGFGLLAAGCMKRRQRSRAARHVLATVTPRPADVGHHGPHVFLRRDQQSVYAGDMVFGATVM